ADSKQLLARHGVPVPAERLAGNAAEAARAAADIGFPVVAKLCGASIAHKTERGLVRLGLRTADDVTAAAVDLLSAATPEDGDVLVGLGEVATADPAIRSIDLNPLIVAAGGVPVAVDALVEVDS